MCNEVLDAVVVQADRVEQSRRRFDGARGGVARRGLKVTVLGITPPSRSIRTNAPSRGHNQTFPMRPAPGS